MTTDARGSRDARKDRWGRSGGGSRIRGALLIGASLLIGAPLPIGATRALAQEYVPQKDQAHPKIRFSDDQLSLNDRCPVRLAKLNLKMAPVYVNGKPIGFC